MLLKVRFKFNKHLLNKLYDRHPGRDSHQAILPDALRFNANLFQTGLCRIPGPMDGFTLAIHGTGCPLPGEHDELSDNLTNLN